MDPNELLQIGLPRLLGLTVTVAEPDRVVAKLVVREEHCTLGHTIHGGAVMAFADTLGAIGTVLKSARWPVHHNDREQDKFLLRRGGGNHSDGGERAAAPRAAHAGVGDPTDQR